jgi:hypothetical protein
MPVPARFGGGGQAGRPAGSEPGSRGGPTTVADIPSVPSCGPASPLAAPSAGAVPRRKKPDTMTARETDAAILDYAEVAGSETPGSPWAQRDAEPFQAPAG